MTDAPVLLFDLGGVLVQTTGRQALRALRPHFGDEEILAKWHACGAVLDFESGRCSPQEFAEAFIADWELGLAPEAFLSEFGSWVSGLYPGARELLDQLAGRYRLACLSNINALHWSRLAQVEELLDHCVLSFQTGWMKPRQEAYRTAAHQLGVAYSDIHFFDDLRANVAAARALGMNAHEVSGIAQTRAALARAGLL